MKLNEQQKTVLKQVMSDPDIKNDFMNNVTKILFTSRHTVDIDSIIKMSLEIRLKCMEMVK